MNHRVLRGLLIVGLIAGAVGITVGLGNLKPPPEKKDVEAVDPLVVVMQLSAQNVDFTVSSQGNVRPATETVLSAEVSGSVVSISPKFVAGGVFERNEILLRIDPTHYEVAVSQSAALLNQRQIEFDGASKLRSQGYRAESEFASAAAALATAEADLVRAERNLERTEIRLPYAGIVRAKEADLGQYVNVGSRLGVTFATDIAEVRLPLTDQDLAFVNLPLATSNDGPSATLSAMQRGKPQHWPARIVRTEGVVDENTRVTYAVARIDDPYRRRSGGTSDSPVLPVGTFVSAAIEGTSATNVLRVPRSSLRGNGQLIVVSPENRLDIRNVEILRSDERYAYVASGVSEGDRISLTIIENPVNGMRVRTDSAAAIDTSVASGEGPGNIEPEENDSDKKDTGGEP